MEFSALRRASKSCASIENIKLCLHSFYQETALGTKIPATKMRKQTKTEEAAAHL